MKLEQATIHNTKVGDKCYIEVEVETVQNILDDKYPIKCDLGSFSERGFRIDTREQNQLYHLRQEEIPTLGEGVEMEVSADGIRWYKRKIVAKTITRYYLDHNFNQWNHARPIELTLEQKYENLLKEHEELKKQLNK